MKDPIVDKLYKETLRVMILSTLINVMASIIDSFVVSRFLGEVSIAAIGVVYPYTVILTAVNVMSLNSLIIEMDNYCRLPGNKSDEK